MTLTKQIDAAINHSEALCRLYDAIEREYGRHIAFALTDALHADPRGSMFRLARITEALRYYMQTTKIDADFPSVP